MRNKRKDSKFLSVGEEADVEEDEGRGRQETNYIYVW